MGRAIKHPVPRPGWAIICNFWHLGILTLSPSVTVPGCQKLPMTTYASLAQDALQLYPYGNSGCQMFNIQLSSTFPASLLLECKMLGWYWHLLLLVWHAPLGVRSAKRRHQSPEWTILSHSYRLIQWEIVWSQVLLYSLHPRSSRTSWWSPPVLRRGSSYDTPGICLIWHCRNVAEQRQTIAKHNGNQEQHEA